MPNNSDERLTLLSKIRNINPSILEHINSQTTKFLLHGDKNFTASTNFVILSSTIEYILATKRFDKTLSLMTSISYDGLEGSSSREFFFYFWRSIFLFLVKPFLSLAKYFLFLGKYILFLRKCFYSLGNICHFPLHLISGGARVSVGHFGNIQTELARAPTHTDKEPASLNTTAWKTC